MSKYIDITLKIITILIFVLIFFVVYAVMTDFHPLLCIIGIYSTLGLLCSVCLFMLVKLAFFEK